MRYFLIIVNLIFFLFSCTVNESIPEIILKNNVKNEYETAVWSIYAINKNENGLKCISNGKSILFENSYSLLSCNLKLDTFKSIRDTLIFYFSFFLNDTCTLCDCGKLINYSDCFPYRNLFIIKGDSTPYFLPNCQIVAYKPYIDYCDSLGLFKNEIKEFPQFLNSYKGVKSEQLIQLIDEHNIN